MLQGRLLNSLSADAIAGATVVLEELRRETVSGADGTFRFENVAPGDLPRVGENDGLFLATDRSDGAAAPDADRRGVDPDLHFQEVASVSAEARSQFDAFQPTTVLAGQELTKQLESSLGATLENQPGVAVRSFGPAPSRPVIRGLDGDRVQILQDGQRTGDLSSQSGDHGVSVNPAAAESIEVVRGPATLLYGANAIGGLVNVITNEIPTRPVKGASGNLTARSRHQRERSRWRRGTCARQRQVSLNLGGGGRHSDDFETPEGEVANSQSRSALRRRRRRRGPASKGYVGGSYGYDDIEVRHSGRRGRHPPIDAEAPCSDVRAAAPSGSNGAFDAFRATLAHRRYKHEELEGEEVGTLFTNDTTELQLMGSHRAVGRMKGSIGGWVLDRAFERVGAEALSPAVDQSGFAAFVYEEVTWPHVTFQFGGRVDRTSYSRSANRSATSRTDRYRAVSCFDRPRPMIGSTIAAASRTPPALRRSRSCSSSASHPGTSRSRSATRTSNPSGRSASTCRCAGAPRGPLVK